MALDFDKSKLSYASRLKGKEKSDEKSNEKSNEKLNICQQREQ